MTTNLLEGIGSKECGCGTHSKPTKPSQGRAESWYDLPLLRPRDPRAWIANLKINGLESTFVRSQSILGASSWIDSPFALTGPVTCQSLHGDDQLTVANANQWSLSHQPGNFASTAVPLPLRKILFMRGGEQWAMNFQINLGPLTYDSLCFTLTENLTSAGDFAGNTQGSIPAFEFQSGLTGIINLQVSIRHLGRVGVCIQGIDNSGYPKSSVFEMDWIVVM
jgi:hypothetical protein